jgi:putative Mg2+ transporter-C (MgtC) family protein
MINMEGVSFEEMLLRLAVATALSGLIGFERERHDQPAGLRTHIILGVGSALIALVSLAVGGVSDRGRIAAGIVTGIGFLGAGAILKYGTSIRGLTTAACLWTVAGIGMCAGFGYLLPALVCTLIVFVTLAFFDKIEKAVLATRAFRKIEIIAKDAKGIIGEIEGVLRDNDIRVRTMGLMSVPPENKIQLSIYARVPSDLDVERLSRAVTAIEGVMEFEII